MQTCSFDPMHGEACHMHLAVYQMNVGNTGGKSVNLVIGRLQLAHGNARRYE